MMSTFQFSLVLVRAIGLYMVVTECASVATQTLQFMVAPPGQMGKPWAYVSMYGYWILVGGVGLLFLLRATFFARLLARGTYEEGHCQRCGYNLSGSDATRCPECGDSGPTGNQGPGETR